MFAVFVFSWSLIEEQKREGLRHVTKNSQTTLVLLKVRSIPVLKLYIGRSVRPFIEKVNSNRDINLVLIEKRNFNFPKEIKFF
ncbi:hypothetical protein NPIL_452721 [Nephila pilipes]|uniref:Uncharacterized protein n=1 Tax=Nephila pilipes TaxID=299642 RepID=A0A8X6T995_NEPPI|nr:hypothetical protein NPIL_452721 [Nephila pilipes]